MNATLTAQSSSQLRHYAHSWACSLFLHLLAIASAVSFLGDLKLAPYVEPFKWDIALVEKVQSDPAKGLSSSQPTVKARQSVRRQPATPPVSGPDISGIGQRIQAVEPEAVQGERPPAQQEEVRDAANSMASITQTSPQLTGPVTEAVLPPDIPQEAASEAVTTPDATVVTGEPAIEAAPKAFQPSESRVDVETSAAASGQGTSAQEQAAAGPSQDPATASIQEVTDREKAVGTPAAAANADFGWLAQALWERVSALKRYPYAARANRLEGQVTLRAVIAENGSLMDVQVAESSGHAVLDRDALEVLRKACPLNLPQPLARPQVVVQIPISYRFHR